MLINQKGLVPLIIATVTATILMSGAGVAVAADTAKPGDFLYNVDKKVEELQVALTMGEVQKDRMRIGIAQERLQEVNQLLENEEPQHDLVEEGMNSLEAHLASVETPANHKNFQEIEKKHQLVIERLDKIFTERIQRFEEKKILLEKELMEAAESGNTENTQRLEKQVQNINEHIQHKQDVQEKIENNFERQKDKLQKIKEKVQDRQTNKPSE